jgi:hyaluronan mediated motility receptor, putative
MYIKKLELLNFQVIKEFSADFTGNVYFITGDNELGKSTLLKAIGALLTGERDAVLRNGEDKGFAKMVVGDDGNEYTVSLNFTKANPRGVLSIKGKTVQSNNVSMLQQLFGYQNFDAVDFCSWSETAEGRRKQIEVVKSLLPKEVQKRIEEIDAEVKEAKEERTHLNRDIKNLGAQVKAAKEGLQPGDITKYGSRIEVTELLERQNVRAQLDAKAQNVQAKLEERISQIEAVPAKQKESLLTFNSEIERIDNVLKDAKRDFELAVEAAKAEYDRKVSVAKFERSDAEERYNNDSEQYYKELEEAERRKANCEKWLQEYEENKEDVDVAEEIKQAQVHNEKAAQVEDYNKRAEQLSEVESSYNELGEKVDTLQHERKELIEKSELPIAGLSFSDEGLTLNNVPFVDGVVSDSQKMEVATKLIIAANPTVKVFRIARGESLGAKRLKAILDVAKQNGFQGFIENVKRGQEEMQVEEYTED